MSEGNLLSEEITQRLLHEIREGCYANCRKLPPELTLAKEMGVSRTLIRDCLSALEREGISDGTNRPPSSERPFFIASADLSFSSLFRVLI